MLSPHIEDTYPHKSLGTPEWEIIIPRSVETRSPRKYPILAFRNQSTNLYSNVGGGKVEWILDSFPPWEVIYDS